MAKISELKKVELLETAVLENDLEMVQALFEEYEEFEFTARALGIACRYSGADMVSVLLRNGVRFEYENTPTFARKYNCNIKISNNYSRRKLYEKWILPAQEVEEIQGEVISQEERSQIFKHLSDYQTGDLQTVLYSAIMFNDTTSVADLTGLGITLKNNYADNLSYLREDEVFSDLLDSGDKKILLSVLTNYLNNIPIDQIKISNSDIVHFVWGKGKVSVLDRYCSVELFDFFARNTNLLEKAKKWDILSNLVKEDNADGIAYVLDGTFILKEKELDELLQLAQESPKVNPALVGCIMDHKKKTLGQDNSHSAKSLMLNDSSLSVAEMKKIWGTKKLEDGTLKITSYKGDMTEIQIPQMIGKNTVSVIDEDAFNPNASRITPVQKKTRERIVSVEIPGTIKEIPRNLFFRKSKYSFSFKAEDQSCLRTVILREGIEIIGGNAFSNSVIEELTIPGSVKEIGNKAFCGCEGLKIVTLPIGLKKIGDSAFSDCVSLEKIGLPNSVSEIGMSAFSGCRSLNDIKLPIGITSLSYALFSHTGLETFEIPDNITEIGESIFSGCTELSSVKLPNSMQEIPNSMFTDCRSLGEIDLPSNIRMIGESAFIRSGLVKCCIPETVSEIGRASFMDCKRLKEIVLPESVHVGEDAFTGCNGLADKSGRIIIEGTLYGFVNMNTDSSIRLPAEQQMSPLVFEQDIERVAISKRFLPAIVCKKGSLSGGEISTNDIVVGSDIIFGRFPIDDDYIPVPLKWRVLAVEDEKAFIITEKEIISLSDEVRQKDVWADSNVRKLLNDGFLDVAFTDEERKQIIRSRIRTQKNKACKADGGPDTEDYVFLLSMEEVEQYMPTEESRKTEATEYAHKQHRPHRDIGFWQLRTPGDGNWGNSVAVSDFSGQYSAMTGNHVGYSYARPAVWIKK